jgi:hypothetical protein
MDLYWLVKDADAIHKAVVHAYFLRKEADPAGSVNTTHTPFFAVVRLTETFRDEFKSRWARLVKDKSVNLDLLDCEGLGSRSITSRIMDRPDLIAALKGKHALEKEFVYDIVLELRIRNEHCDVLKTFEGRVEAEDAFQVRISSVRHMCIQRDTDIPHPGKRGELEPRLARIRRRCP